MRTLLKSVFSTTTQLINIKEFFYENWDVEREVFVDHNGTKKQYNISAFLFSSTILYNEMKWNAVLLKLDLVSTVHLCLSTSH